MRVISRPGVPTELNITCDKCKAVLSFTPLDVKDSDTMGFYVICGACGRPTGVGLLLPNAWKKMIERIDEPTGG